MNCHSDIVIELLLLWRVVDINTSLQLLTVVATDMRW